MLDRTGQSFDSLARALDNFQKQQQQRFGRVSKQNIQSAAMVQISSLLGLVLLCLALAHRSEYSMAWV